jgi:SAM-dependent methyltransferase
MTTTERQLDTADLTERVKGMYQEVALHPEHEFHFETGRPLAERLGYPAADLDRIPAAAIDSFAGVGYFLDLAAIAPGEVVLDLGSGSGTDSFAAAAFVGPAGAVVGVDFTPEQWEKSCRLAEEAGVGAVVEFWERRIEHLPAADESFDCAISNGVINLAADKGIVFAEIARVLRPGGRLAIADIVSERQLVDAIVCDTDLWASCIGGATQEDAYRDAIEAAGLRVEAVRPNDYAFLTDQALGASRRYGVKSVSVLARKV